MSQLVSKTASLPTTRLAAEWKRLLAAFLARFTTRLRTSRSAGTRFRHPLRRWERDEGGDGVVRGGELPRVFPETRARVRADQDPRGDELLEHHLLSVPV
ncbi:MAG: hypothetical protein ACTSSA_09790 [Candidatus Freyarchaeota archaeon]